VKSFKTIFMGAIIAGLLLVTANSAMAAYTGLYENENDSSLFVDLGAGNFSISGGSLYTVNDLGNDFWSASGGGGYYYGFSQGAEFGFFQASYELSQAIIEDVSSSVMSTVNTFIGLIETGSTPEQAIASMQFDLIMLGFKMASYNLMGSPIGYGIFAADGESFDLTMGSLSLDGLQAMLCDNCTETYTKATPIPGAVWLLGSGLVGLVGLRRRMRG
jgi:hypothetical protein